MMNDTGRLAKHIQLRARKSVPTREKDEMGA